MFYAQYTTGNISTNSLIVVSDKRSKVIDYNDVYESSYDFDYSLIEENNSRPPVMMAKDRSPVRWIMC